MSFNLSEVIKDFESVFDNGDNCDVIIKAGEEPDIKELKAHSFVLRARCPYFKRALSSDWEDKDDDGNFVFRKPNISAEVFQLILRYLYTGILVCGQHDNELILKCLDAADELGLERMIDHIQNDKFLLRDPVNTLQVIEMIGQHDPLENLKDYCLETIIEEPRILFSSEKFPLLERSTIIMILERDDLNMEEIEIWESILRWLVVHYLKNNKDDTIWPSNDLKNVYQTIKEYIPLIRFYDISKDDFFLKVYPYKDLFPQDLLNDVLRCHMVSDSTPMPSYKPSRHRNYESILVNRSAFRLFSKWIDNKNEDYNQQNIPYKFELLLRGSRDGFDSATFHKLCDDKGATISFAGVKDSNQIIGGYNPINWYSNNTYINTNDSFLFNITDVNDLNSAKVGRCNNSNNSIYNHSSYGPTFGSGNDLRAQGISWAANIGSYANINIPNNFTINEYEVFKVLRKT